jgi:hypothetical protein
MSDALTEHRLHSLEEAVQELASAATAQIEFNTAVRTWGKVGLMVYAFGQSILVGVIIWGFQQVAS